MLGEKQFPGAGGHPGADDPVQKYADLSIGADPTAIYLVRFHVPGPRLKRKNP